MYSQNNEEEIILSYFRDKDNGRFIDIGAYDVFRFSNVRALFEKGWSGVLVEPAPSNFKGLHDHYKDETRIVLINAAIGEKEGEIDFYDSGGDAVSTSNEEHKEKWGAAGIPYTKTKVTQIGTVYFFDQYYRGTDFLSIDTEATNFPVFSQIPDFVFEQIKMICIEHDQKEKEITERLKPFGFRQLLFNAENIILAK